MTVIRGGEGKSESIHSAMAAGVPSSGGDLEEQWGPDKRFYCNMNVLPVLNCWVLGQFLRLEISFRGQLLSLKAP